jgi:hypothetical protein
VLYYDKSLSIKTGEFTLSEDFGFINLSLLTPGKVETFYQKEFISNAGMCQSILNCILEKIFAEKEGLNESLDDSQFHIYKNVEFVLWKADQRKHFETSSFLDSLNESRDDSINDSISNNAYDQNEG